MAPNGSTKNSRRRLKAPRHYSGLNNRTKVTSGKRRVHHDIIEGINIYSFRSELELEYFSNIEEPLPRKMKRFRGFEETDDSVNLIKNSFDEYVRNFIDNPHSSRAVRPTEDGHERAGDPHVVAAEKQVSTIILVSDEENSLNTTDSVPNDDTRGPDDIASFQIVSKPVEVITIDESDSDDGILMISDPKEDGRKREGESRVMAANEQVSTIILVSDEENSLSTTDSVPNVDTRGPDGITSFQIENKLVEVITIDESDSDDGDVMISDSKAFIPQPVRYSACLNCGKNKRSKPHENRSITSEPDRDTGLDDLSVITDEVISLMDEDFLVHSEEFAVQPEQTPTHSWDLPMLTRPEGATVHPKDVTMSTQPEGLTAQHEDMPMSSHSTGKLVNLKDAATQSEGSIVQLGDGPMPVLPIGAPVELEVSTQSEDVLVHPNDVPPQPKKLSIQPEKQSTPRTRESIVTTPGDESSLKLHGMSSLTDQPGSSSSFPPHISPKTHKPSSSPNKMSPIAPGTIRVILPDTGKTVILKFDGAKSKISAPSTKPLAHSYQVTIPPNKIHQLTVPPGFPDENRGTRTQPINEPLGRFQVRNSCDAKSGVVATDILQDGLAILSQLKQQTLESVDARDGISHAKSLKEIHSASDSGKFNDSAVLMSPESDVSSVGSPTITEPSSSKLLVVDHATRSVVQDLVDFVCRKECFPASYPYDCMRRERPCLTVPCRELRCRMGCICASLAKKNVRRVRCKKDSCIFVCTCSFFGVAPPANRHAKTRQNVKKVLGISSGQKVLTVPAKSDTDSSTSQPPSSGILLPMKVLGSRTACGVGGSSGSKEYSHGSVTLPDSNSTRLESGFGHKDLQHPPKRLCLQKPGSIASQPSCQDSVKGLTVSLTQPRRFFGREKIPIPEQALVCLTPGLGYVPLVEMSPKVIIHNPFKPGTTKSFLHIRLATEWLNSNLQAVLSTTTDLRWVVADKSTIEKEQLHRLSIDFFNR